MSAAVRGRVAWVAALGTVLVFLPGSGTWDPAEARPIAGDAHVASIRPGATDGGQPTSTDREPSRVPTPVGPLPPGPTAAAATPAPAMAGPPTPSPSSRATPARAATTPRPVPAIDLACSGTVATTPLDPGARWRDVVVDPVRRLPDGWRPDDLVEVPEVAFVDAPAPQVRRLVVADLKAMHRAADRAGAPFRVVSAFRSQDYQRQVWERAVRAEGGADAARAGTARPGHSEHQLGTTVDVVDPSLPRLVRGLVDRPAGRWLAEHAVDFGFVVSYPAGERATTCYKAEPWHLRYVGPDRAARMAATSLTPREYLLQAGARTTPEP